MLYFNSLRPTFHEIDIFVNYIKKLIHDYTSKISSNDGSPSIFSTNL